MTDPQNDAGSDAESDAEGIADPPGEASGFAKHWWLNIVRGTAALLLGIGLLLPVEIIFESESLQDILFQFIAIYLLFSGVMSLIWGFSNRKRTGIWLVAGVLGVVGGIAFLLRSFLESQLSTDSLTLIFGLIMLLAGFIHLLGGFRLGQRYGRRWSLGHEFLGVVEIVIGLLVLISIYTPVENLKIILSFWGILAGIGLLADGFRMRKLINSQKQTQAEKPPN